MNYINLIDKISNEDKQILTTYINKYGCKLENFIGLDSWL